MEQNSGTYGYWAIQSNIYFYNPKKGLLVNFDTTSSNQELNTYFSVFGGEKVEELEKVNPTHFLIHMIPEIFLSGLYGALKFKS